MYKILLNKSHLSLVSDFNIDILARISCIRSVENRWCKFKHY